MSIGRGTEQAADSGRSVRGRGPRAKGGRALLPALAACVCLAAFAAGWACRASVGGGPAANPPERLTGQGAAAAPATAAQTVVVTTTLTPEGFEPGEVRHAAGSFALKVGNQSGEEEVVLRLTDSAGEKVTEVKLTEKVRDWMAPVELAAGTYTLSEAAHPQWTCRIEVTAQ